MYKVVPSSKYKRDLRLVIKQGKDIQELETVIDILRKVKNFPPNMTTTRLKANIKVLVNATFAPIGY